MTAPWLSVVIPSHDGERWLAQALQSLVDQHDDGVECIVIDSSATPATLQIAQGFSRQLSIATHRRPDLPAWTAKINFGAALAQAGHLCILHQDDLWRPGRSLQLRQWLQASPDGLLYLHPSLIIDQRGRVLGTLRCPLPSDGAHVPNALLLERLLVQNFVAIPAPTIRRDAYLAVAGMDVPLWYTADWDLYFKLAMAGPVYYRDEPMTCFRIHADSLTISGSRNAEDFRLQLQTVIERYAPYLPVSSQKAVLSAARAALEVNVALAAAQNGDASKLLAACLRVAALGPAGMRRFLRDSRLLERVIPRLRARLAGGL
jgi:glycosyltransferase involved in cell wall biosynthesis